MQHDAMPLDKSQTLPDLCHAMLHYILLHRVTLSMIKVHLK